MYEDRMTTGWQHNFQKEKPWSIEKERKLVCFGNPGYVMQWDRIASYDTRAEAEAELAKFNSRRDPTNRERYQLVDNRNNQWIVK